MKSEMVRQGDVLLVKIDDMPNSAEEIESTGRIVLAYGEVTGHAHAIAVAQAKLFIDGQTRFLKVGDAGADLVHEEHSTIHLTPGLYRIVQQREYIPQSSRLVLD